MRKTCWLLILLGLILARPAVAEPSYSSPEALLKTYLQALQSGNYEFVDACYTSSSRQFLQSNPDLIAERTQQTLMSTYEHLAKLEFTTEKVSARRAILHPSDPKVPPLYARIQDPNEGWRLDWRFMTDYLRVNENGWSLRNPKAESLWRSRP